MKKEIEVEIRAEIPKEKKDQIEGLLNEMGRLTEHNKRLSVMIENEKGDVDLRIRTTGDYSEVVLKKGDYHSHNRLEIYQEIEKNQFLGMVNLLTNIGMKTIIGERENYNYDIGNGITAVFVKAADICYLELEKMSSAEDELQNAKDLAKIAKKFDLQIMDKQDFDNLCNKLSKEADWVFLNTEEDYKRLEKAFLRY